MNLDLPFKTNEKFISISLLILFNILPNFFKIPFRRFSPADLKGVLDTAHLIAVHEVLEGGYTKARPKISLKALIDAFNSTKPSLSDADYTFFTSIYNPFRGLQSIQPSDVPLKTALK